ncbi:MAG: hypothetical protein HDR97_06810 [Bacteroides sp.]|nr:hypothetical protein [Bacteroides sp.]
MNCFIFSLRTIATRLLVALAITGMSAAMVSCGDDDLPEPSNPGTEEPDTPPAPALGRRTVLVYMVANNSLGTNWHCDEADLQEMLKATPTGLPDDCRLLVYHNPPRCSETNPCVLIDVTATGLKTIKTYTYSEEGESVTTERMQEVIADMKSLAPAHDYGIVFWSHADNWLGNSGPNDNRYRGFGQDGNYRMSMPTLARTLEGERFAFLYFDCCLMGNVEPLYEMRSLAPLAVASPTELGIDGMPYHWNVPVMFDDSLSDEEKCKTMAANTFRYYQNHAEECTGTCYTKSSECQMTVVNLDNLDALAEATRKIMAKVETLPYTVRGIQSYSRDYEAYDMDDLMELLTPADSQELLTAWRQELSNTVLSSHFTSEAIGNANIYRYCGLGVFGMTDVTDQYYRSYNTLQWWADVVSTAPAFNESEQ